MNLKKYFAVNFDPRHIISQRRKLNKYNPFEHLVEGLAERDNWMEYQVHMKYAEVLQENPLAIIKSTEVITPTPSKAGMPGNRTHSEAMETEDEENLGTSKRQKTESEGQLYR